MIIVLEGVNGVGKSTLAAGLAKELGGRIVRPFRHGAEHMDADERAADLKALGIPVNTYVEDMFVADFLRQTQAGAEAPVILDRSLPSAVAYGPLDGVVGGTVASPTRTDRLLREWIGALSELDVRYIWVRASNDVVRRRSERCHSAAQQRTLENKFALIFQKVPFKKMCLDTSEAGIERNLWRVASWVNDIDRKTPCPKR